MLVLLAAIAATPCAFDETAAPASTAAEYHSRCYKFVGTAASDQERLLAIVEAGFGSLAPFSALIRGIFRDARATHLEVKIDKLQATLESKEEKIDQLQASVSRLEAIEAKLDRLLGAT